MGMDARFLFKSNNTLAAISNYIQAYIQPAVNPITGPVVVTDPIISLSPLAYYHADDGYYTDGALRIGKAPPSTFIANYVKSTSTDFQTGSAASWSLCCAVRFLAGSPAIVTPAVQTIISKRATNNHEFSLRRDPTTGFISLIVYDSTGASTHTVTSTVATAAGTTAYVCAWFDFSAGKTYILVNSETKVPSASLAITITKGTADWRIGSDAITSLPGYFDIDSVGWAEGYAFSDADVALLNSGKRFQDLSAGLITAFTRPKSAWYDCGNGTLDPATLDNWDWFEDSNSNLHRLTAVGVSSQQPYMVRGLIAPVVTATSTGGPTRFWPDRSGNGYDAVCPWPSNGTKNRPGYSATGWTDGTAAYYFQGTDLTGDPRMSGSAMYSFDAVISGVLDGTNVPWSAMWVVKKTNPYKPGPSGTEANFFGEDLGGIGSSGYVPWYAWGATIDSTFAGHNIGFLSGTRADNITTTMYGHHVSTRGDTAGSVNRQPDNYLYAVDTNATVYTAVFDGTTTTLKANGVTLGTWTQSALTAQTIRALFIFAHAGGSDTTAGFAGSGVRFWAGNSALYGYCKACAYWARALTPTEEATILTTFLPTPTIGPALNFPVRSTNLYKWYSAYTWGPFVERTSPATRCVADSDLAGFWTARNSTSSGTGMATIPFAADADGNRSTYVIESGKPAIYVNGVGTKKMQATSFTLSQPFTWFLVAKLVRNSGTGSFYEWVWISTAGGGCEVYTYGTTLAGYAGAELISSALTHGDYHIYDGVVSGSSSDLWVDGVQVASGAMGSVGISALLDLAYRSSHAGKGYFREMLWYSEAMSAPNRALERARLKAIWGTP